MRALILLTLIVHTSLAQNLKTLKPVAYGPEHPYTEAEAEAWENAIHNLNDYDVYSALPTEEKKLADSLEMGYGPITQTGCNWYCGGGPYKTTASSQLKNTTFATYDAANVHDMNLLTAWAPKAGKGIGEKLFFHFEGRSPRVNKIIIYNGYTKNTDLWKQNARVKKLKLSIDSVPYAILALDDYSGAQTFEIEPQQSGLRNVDLVFTFEILEVYPGTKYKDVVVSEINFGGLDVHCFTGETGILMAGGPLASIASIETGDSVVTYNALTGQWSADEVKEKIAVRHCGLVQLQFDHTSVTCTADHPFLRADGTWVSFDPERSNRLYVQDTPVRKLNTGDQIISFLNGKPVLCTFQNAHTERGMWMTYTLVLKNGQSFVANGCVVQVEKPAYP